MLSTTSYAEFQAMSYSQDYVAISMEMLGDRYTPVTVFESVVKNTEQAILLDTSDYPKHIQADAGVFIGLHPLANFTAFGREITISTADDCQQFTADPFAALRKFYHQYHASAQGALAKLAGGIIGLVSYDAIRLLENIPDRHPNEDKIPDLQFTSYGTFIIFDRRTAKIVLVKVVKNHGDKEKIYCNTLDMLNSLQLKIIQGHSHLPGKQKNISTVEPQVDSDDASFGKIVENAKAYIKNGDAFQIVASRRFQQSFAGNDFNVYRALKALNPSPYMYYIRCDAYSVVGASPEKMVSLQNGMVNISPIAGSRPRGLTPEEDACLVAELLNDPKELAEHMMLVDLARNDVGRVCKPGSVQVLNTKIINKFSHIMHLTSAVQGELRDDCDAFDVLVAGFPAGTLSGAPKIRAMQIIDELETSRRGFYGGAVCAIDNQGQMDSCILIRTAFIKNGVATVRAGGGIVLESDAQTEAEETRNKARGVLLALQCAEEIE